MFTALPPPNQAAKAKTRALPRFLGDGEDDDDTGPSNPLDLFSDAEYDGPSLRNNDEEVILDPTSERFGKKKEEVEVEKQALPKRVIPKLDEALLVGPKGLTKLVEMSKGFKSRGKGHEAEDLTRLLMLYQVWGHQMFPRMAFHDTIERVELLCHKTRVQGHLKELKNPPREESPAPIHPTESDMMNGGRNTEQLPTTSRPLRINQDVDTELDALLANPQAFSQRQTLNTNPVNNVDEEEELNILRAMEGDGQAFRDQQGGSGWKASKGDMGMDIDMDGDPDELAAMEESNALFRARTPDNEPNEGHPMQLPLKIRSPRKFKAVLSSEDEPDEEVGYCTEEDGLEMEVGMKSDADLEFDDDDEDLLREMEELDKAQNIRLISDEHVEVRGKEKEAVEMQVEDDEELYA